MAMTLEGFAASTTQVPTTSIEHAYETMCRDESLLRQAGYEHIADFSLMYAMATGGVLLARNDGRFAEPEQLKTSVCDFEYRFRSQVLHLAAGDTEKIRPAWRPLLLGSAALTARPINRQMAGMIAHVQADLPESAVDSGAIHNDAYMQKDWDPVNDILRETGHLLSETSVVLPSSLQRLMPLMMQSGVRRIITDRGVDVIADMRDAARDDAYRLKNLQDDPTARAAFIADLDSRAAANATAMLRGSRTMISYFLRAM